MRIVRVARRGTALVAQSAGIVIYSAAQYGLFSYLLVAGNLRAGGDFALAQAIIAPVLAFLSLSLRQLWVSQTRRGLVYGDLLRVRLATTAAGTAAVAVGVELSNIQIRPAIFILVLAIKTQEAIADILYARFDAAGRSSLVGLLLTIKGGAILTAVGVGFLAGWLIDMTSSAIVGLVSIVLLIEAAIASTCPAGAPYSAGLWRRLSPEIGGLAWLSAANVVVTLGGFLPRYALDIIAGRDAVGLFSAVTIPVALMLLVCTGLAQSSLLEIGRAVEERDHRRWARLLVEQVALIVAMVLGLAAACWLGATAALSMLGRQVPGDLIPVMVLILPIFIPSFVAQIVSYGFLAARDFRALAVLNLLALLVQVALAWPLVRWQPIFGAALMSATGSLVQLGGFAFLLRRHFLQVSPKEASLA